MKRVVRYLRIQDDINVVKVMTTERMEKVVEDLGGKGLYISNEATVEALKELRREYSEDVSLEKVREITGRVWKKYRATLSDEVKYIRRRG